MEATVTCPNGHVNPIGADVCAECGQSLTSEVAPDLGEEGTTAASGGPEPASPSPEPEAATTIPPPYAAEPLTPAPPQEDTATVPQTGVEPHPSEPESEPLTPDPAPQPEPEEPPPPAPPPPPAASSEIATPVAPQPPPEAAPPRMSGRSIAALLGFAAAALATLRKILKRRARR